MIFAIINDEETTYSIKELWQYDYGQVLRIQNLNTEKYAIEIHFSTEENFGESITRIATNNGGSFDVTIPDSVLENKCASKDYFIYAFIYITGQSSGNTIKKIIIPVRSRPKPEGREQNDNNTMTAILKAVNSIADGKADGLKYEDDILSLMAGEKNIASVTITGGLGSGTDGREVELQNNGIHIQWRYEGEESWTNLIALEDIKGPAGPAGEKGDPGAITPEQISGAVEEYFASNPIQAGATEDQARQIEKNTQDISKLSDEIANEDLVIGEDGRLYIKQGDGTEKGTGVELPLSGEVTDEQVQSAINNYITENGLTFSFTLTDAKYKGYVTSESVVTNKPVVSDYTDYKIIPKNETVEFTGTLGSENSLVLIPVTPITTETIDKMYFDNDYYIRPYVYNSGILITIFNTNYTLAVQNLSGTNIKACCFDKKGRYYCDNSVLSGDYITNYLLTNTYDITYFRNSTNTNYVAISYSRAITDDEFTQLANQFGGVA